MSSGTGVIPPSLQVSGDQEGKADVGIVGIGVMGSNLALNLLSKGFVVAVWNLEVDVTQKFVAECDKDFGAGKLLGSATYEDFAKLLRPPRKSFILVTAGKATDMVIENLKRVFSANDIIVDTGNAHFKDQSRRAEEVEAAGLRFLGMGISGGAEGARKGPAFFPGGTLSIWEDIRPIVEAAAAKAKDGRPCVTMNGRGGAGSCVKMYHNAGEYAVLQIWAETFAIMRGVGLEGSKIREVLESWKAKGPLDSYMLDITIQVATKKDDAAEGATLLVDRTADMIGSKGTGLWSVQVAMDVGCPAPSLAAAVLARQMSMVRPERMINEKRLGGFVQRPAQKLEGPELDSFLEELEHAVFLSIVASYAQMFQCVRAVDKEFELEITPNLPRIISTFRAGCILQGALLEPMTKAFEADPNLSNLLCAFPKEIETGMDAFRKTMATAALAGEPATVMQASLGYLATMTRATMVAGQVVSLQRDVFGRHGFKRLKTSGEATEESYNADWPDMIP
mmetsp:Transcript_1621/g.3543  ORF Transcript_1621/g.3543 Transcript_1621/m.3543 type:complete len:508 (+) Transcript_1621:125-1648(+)